MRTSPTPRSPRLAIAVALALLATLAPVAGPRAAAAIGFDKSLLKGESSTNPTSLQFGPDGRLYVAQQNGLIKVYEVARDGANDYTVLSTETISSIRSIPNHDDDGTPNPSVVGRLVLGIVVIGTASNPVLYVTSSDPRAGAFDAGDVNLDTNSGILSRLRWNGSQWGKLDLVRGLPRSEEVHASNGMALDATTNTLYLAQGGHTNQGAPSTVFAGLPEYALSAAVLSIDLDAIGGSTYNLPTLNDGTRSGNPDPNDPFGGNDGRNQARLVAGGPVQVYSPGYRNAYDVVLTKAGQLFTIDNGPGNGQGGPPVNEGPGGNCTNGFNESSSRADDQLHRIATEGSYGGHPNPTRGNSDNTFGGQSPVPAENPVECDYRAAGADGSLTTFPGSTNGIAEYRGSNFGGAMRGDLLAAGWTGDAVFRLNLNQAGTDLISSSTLFSSVGTRPLDVTALGSQASFPGTIWVADHSASSIVVFEPDDYDGGGGECTGADDPSLDEDDDGYTNADEIENGTDPCSAGDVPPDADGDLVSDRNDRDDDNDGLPDKTDPFAVDAANGGATTLPVRLTWDPDDPDPGGLANTGFTGLMTDGVTDYRRLFDVDNMTVGGAFGGLGVDRVPDGTALGVANTQRYGFQLGLDAGPDTTGPFRVRTRIVAPFAGLDPEDDQSLGLAVGAGDQDEYLSLVLHANGGNGGVRLMKEVGGTPTIPDKEPLALPGPDYVNLSLRIDPSDGSVSPSFRATIGGQQQPRRELATATIPTEWFDRSTGFAAGVIATSAGPAPAFPATWDLFRVSALPGGTSAALMSPEIRPRAASIGTWETRAPSGLNRQEVSYVRVGSKFYLAGGSTSGVGQITAHQVYNAKTDRWHNRTPLPNALDHIPGVAVGGKIYYIGGIEQWPDDHANTVYIYDPTTNSFSQGASMLPGRGRGAGGAAAYQGKIYYAGGLHNGDSVPWFDVYDPATNTWEQLADMPTGRDHFHAAIVDGSLYAIGGRRNGTRVGVNEVYDLSAEEWIEGFAPLPTLRAGFASAAVGKRILVIGGEGGGQTFDDVEAYNTVRDRWRRLASMPTARHGIQAVVWHGGVYIAAGGTVQGGGGATAVHEVFFPDG